MKRVISILLMILAIFTLASCGGPAEPHTPSETVYETLNKIFTKEHPLVNIEVTTETNGTVLSSLYVISKEVKGDRIAYSVEALNTFGEIDGELVIPESYKATCKGTVLLSNGNIFEQTGDAVELDLTQVQIPRFDFKESYFSDVKNENGKLTANVTNPSALLGTSISCSDMGVSVSYSTTSISEIVLNYTESNTKATIKYSFN